MTRNFKLGLSWTTKVFLGMVAFTFAYGWSSLLYHSITTGALTKLQGEAFIGGFQACQEQYQIPKKLWVIKK